MKGPDMLIIQDYKMEGDLPTDFSQRSIKGHAQCLTSGLHPGMSGPLEVRLRSTQPATLEQC